MTDTATKVRLKAIGVAEGAFREAIYAADEARDKAVTAAWEVRLEALAAANKNYYKATAKEAQSE